MSYQEAPSTPVPAADPALTTTAVSPTGATSSASLPSSSSSLVTTQAKVAKPKKKSKKLCHYKQCTSPHSIIGDCSFCFKKFCTRHRLLESHDCEHYRDVQKEYHDRNAKQLQSQQTVVSKV